MPTFYKIHYHCSMKDINVLAKAIKDGGDWTLFLDRDGVINRRIPDGYVKHSGQFMYLDGALDAVVGLSKSFGHTFVVTNQQGVGRGLMTEADLLAIHSQLTKDVISKGGKINQIYHSPDLKWHINNSRKPNPDMALWAKRDFPAIDFSQSVMVGDSTSDIEFGKNLGMMTVLITTKGEKANPDFAFPSLADFYHSLST